MFVPRAELGLADKLHIEDIDMDALSEPKEELRHFLLRHVEGQIEGDDSGR